jgi:hypothetical protein
MNPGTSGCIRGIVTFCGENHPTSEVRGMISLF